MFPTVAGAKTGQVQSPIVPPLSSALHNQHNLEKLPVPGPSYSYPPWTQCRQRMQNHPALSPPSPKEAHMHTPKAVVRGPSFQCSRHQRLSMMHAPTTRDQGNRRTLPLPSPLPTPSHQHLSKRSFPAFYFQVLQWTLSKAPGEKEGQWGEEKAVLGKVAGRGWGWLED